MVQEVQKSRKVGLVLTLELPSLPHAVLYNQTVVGPRHAGAIEDPSSPSASLLPLYDPEVLYCCTPTVLRHLVWFTRVLYLGFA